MADQFQVVLEENAQIIAPPEPNKTASPLATALGSVSDMLGGFVQSREQQRAKRKEEARLKKEADESAAAGALFDGAVAINNGTVGTPFDKVGKQVVNSDVGESLGVGIPDIKALRSASNQDLAVSIVESAVASGEVDQDTVDQVASFARNAQQQVAVNDAAISQGKLPGISRDALMDRLLQEVRAKYPQVDVKVLSSTLQAFGLTNTVFNELRKENLDIAALNEASRNSRAKALEQGRLMAGPAAEFASEQDLIKLGSENLQTIELTKQTREQLELTSLGQDIDKKKREAIEKEAGDTLRQTTVQQVTGQLAPMLNMLNEAITIAGQPGADPNIEKKIEDIKLHFSQYSSAIVENAITQLAIKDVGEAEEMRKFLTGYIENTFIKPLEQRDQTVINLTKKMKDKIGLDMTMSMPFITMAREAGINLSVVDSLMGQLDPSTADRLKKEMSGLANLDLRTALNRDSGMLYVSEIMSVLKGDTRLSELNYTPEKAKQAFATVHRVNKDISQKIIGGDMADANTFLNTGEEFLIAAGALNRQSGQRANVNAMLLVTDEGRGQTVINKLMADPAYAEEGKLYGLASRAAAAKVMMNLRNEDRTEGYHSIGWDAKAGRYNVVFDEKRWQANNKTGAQAQVDWRFGGYGETLKGAKAPPPPPRRLKELSNTMNLGVTYLTNTRSWDDQAPKGTDLELRNWYGQGKQTEAMRKQEATRSKSKPGSQSDILKRLDALDQELLKGRLPLEAPTVAGAEGISVNADGSASAQNKQGKTITVRPVAQIKEKYADNPIYKTLVSRAEATGMPVDLVVSLIGNMENRSFSNKAAATTRRGKAHGVMQVHDADWDSTSVKRYGKKVAELSPEQNIDLGLWILAQNYKTAGNWPDALSMYHSGVSLSKAKEQKRNDGNIDTDQYVSLIMHGAGM